MTGTKRKDHDFGGRLAALVHNGKLNAESVKTVAEAYAYSTYTGHRAIAAFFTTWDAYWNRKTYYAAGGTE